MGVGRSKGTLAFQLAGNIVYLNHGAGLVSGYFHLSEQLVEAGVRGGITAEILFNLHDNNDDGRVRPSELIENFELGPIHVFDISGTLDAFLESVADKKKS